MYDDIMIFNPVAYLRVYEENVVFKNYCILTFYTPMVKWNTS